jgi:prevent-host-death family protein
VATIPQRELRNDISSILRRAEAGEEFEITVDGRPVARLSGLGVRRRFIPAEEFVALFTIPGPADTTFFDDIAEGVDHAPSDPFARNA